MGLDRVVRQEQPSPDLDVGQTFRGETNHLELALSKRLAGRDYTAVNTRLGTNGHVYRTLSARRVGRAKITR
jgi:hypothetical protein